MMTKAVEQQQYHIWTTNGYVRLSMAEIGVIVAGLSCYGDMTKPSFFGTVALWCNVAMSPGASFELSDLLYIATMNVLGNYIDYLSEMQLDSDELRSVWIKLNLNYVDKQRLAEVTTPPPVKEKKHARKKKRSS